MVLTRKWALQVRPLPVRVTTSAGSKRSAIAARPDQAEGVVLRVLELRTEFLAKDGAVRAVRGVSFDLRRAEKLGIVGESGSGKSALALSILGLIEPPGRITGGEVWLNGRNIGQLSERKLHAIRGQEISLIFQDPMSALNPVKPIGYQLIETIRRHQKLSRQAARERAVQLLREVEMPLAEKRLDDYPHQYSGGMRQRVMIAIALANDPDVLIADEPTTALDVTTQAQVLDLLERLADEHHAAIIFITHNLGIVAEFCDTVQVMYAGRTVERAPTQEIFHRPAHPYTKALLESVPRPDRLQPGLLPAIPGMPPNLAALPKGCSFEPRCPLGKGREVCLNQAPFPVQVGSTDRPAFAECHFALEQLEGSAGDRSDYK
jgi:oligopeptide/dipeptide ABC transporter ATP-binding protein